MGLLSWWRGSNKDSSSSSSAAKQPDPKPQPPPPPGAVEEVPQRRPPVGADDVTIFEFGSVAASADKVTLAGFCPVSDDLQPCRWELFPAAADAAPQFRVIF